MKIFSIARSVAVAATVAFAPSFAIAAAPCTDVERDVADLIARAKMFWQTDAFREHGWSDEGPTNGWLEDLKEVRDGLGDQETLAFRLKHSFVPNEIYMTATQYMLSGELEGHWIRAAAAIDRAPTCEN